MPISWVRSGNNVGNDTLDADRGKDQSNRGKNGEERHIESRSFESCRW